MIWDASWCFSAPYRSEILAFLQAAERVAETLAQLNKDPEIQKLLKSNRPASKELAIKLLNHPAVLALLDQATFRAAAMSAFRDTVIPDGKH